MALLRSTVLICAVHKYCPEFDNQSQEPTRRIISNDGFCGNQTSQFTRVLPTIALEATSITMAKHNHLPTKDFLLTRDHVA